MSWAPPLLIVALVITGCATKRPPLTYRYARNAKTEIVAPPVLRPTLTWKRSIPNPPRAAACDINIPGYSVTWRRNVASIRVAPADFPPGDRVPVDVLDGITQFRKALAALESNGCLAAGDADRLLQAITEATPMNPATAYYLRYGAYGVTGAFDPIPPFRFRVVGATKQNGKSGFLTAYYTLAARPEGGYILALSSMEQTIEGQATPLPSSARQPLEIPDWATYFRIFFLTRRSASDHDMLIVGSRTRHALNTVSAPNCKSSADVFCLPVPLGLAVRAELSITIDNKPVFVGLGGRLGEAFHAAGIAKPDPKGLTIERAYNGKLIPIDFDRQTNDILNLTLLGGERILLHSSTGINR